MISRGDSDMEIVKRLLTDEKKNWLKDLLETNDAHGMKAEIHIVDANYSMQVVYMNIKKIIESVTE